MVCLSGEDQFHCIVTLLITIYIIVSLPLYLLVIIVLIRRRKQLKYSFFRICVSVGIADCLLLIVRVLLRIVLPAAVYSTHERTLMTDMFETWVRHFFLK